MKVTEYGAWQGASSPEPVQLFSRRHVNYLLLIRLVDIASSGFLTERRNQPVLKGPSTQTAPPAIGRLSLPVVIDETDAISRSLAPSERPF